MLAFSPKLDTVRYKNEITVGIYASLFKMCIYIKGTLTPSHRLTHEVVHGQDVPLVAETANPRWSAEHSHQPDCETLGSEIHRKIK